MRRQEAIELSIRIQREDPLFVVQEIGRRGQDGAWALKVCDTITGRRAIIMDAARWPQLRDAARQEQRELLHPAFEGDTRPTKASESAESVREDEQVPTV